MKALIIAALTLTFCGCGGLNRDSAKELIDNNAERYVQEKVRYPITLGLTATCPFSRDPMFRFLLQKKLITVTQPLDYELTKEGTKFFDGEGEHLYAASTKPGCDIAQLDVVLGHRGSAVVTGIIMGETSAIVQYERTVTLTPLGEEFTIFRRKFNLEEQISWRQTAKIFNIPDRQILGPSTDFYTAHFVKFDDGWRITSIQNR